MSSSSAELPTPEGPGSVSGAPNLPAGFADTFTSRYIDTSAAPARGRRRRGTAAAAGARVAGELVRVTALAADVQTVVIPATGHWVAEDAPEEMLTALTSFLAAYRDGSDAAAPTQDAAALR